MLLLVLDTCTERLLAGIRDTDTAGTGDRWINLHAHGNHVEDLLSAVDAVLASRRPDAVGVAVGPGSFTGVRIGLASAKGLVEGWGVPLMGLDNLAAMADAAGRLSSIPDCAVLPVIDARKGKFYGALYDGRRELVAPSDRAPHNWVQAASAAWAGPIVVSGYQAALLQGALGASFPEQWTVLPVRDWMPGLLDQAEAAWKAKAFLERSASPRYLRLSEAEENLNARLRG